MHICILGAGVIGVTSAYRLLQDGHEVTLLDSRPVAGGGTSMGNGAQLSYSYIAPLADPSVWTHWPHYLFSADSPLTLKPKLDPAQWRWLLKFLGACNAERVQRTTIELLQLAFYSRDELTQLHQAVPFDFSHRAAGKLVMYTDPAGLVSARKQVAFQSQYGCQQEVIDAARCLEIEPALGNASRNWAGGVYTPSEEAGDCAQFCQGLVTAMSSNAGFRFLPSTTVTQVNMKDGAIASVQAASEVAGASTQAIDADAFVLALGADSAAFARQAGFRLPLYPLKGYSITVPLNDSFAQSAAPQVSITDISKKIVYARLGNRLRVAGRVELVGMDTHIPDRAINELIDGANELFPGSIRDQKAAQLSPWAGFRPATPSGVPVIGASPVKNLYLNIGQGALGWTLACGSAALLAAQIGGRKTAIDVAPFRYGR
jgi:D-amino-acid dehydrogenase